MYGKQNRACCRRAMDKALLYWDYITPILSQQTTTPELTQLLYCALYRTGNRSDANTLSAGNVSKLQPYREALPDSLELYVGEEAPHALYELRVLALLHSLQLHGQPIGVLRFEIL